jgi:hypothetical protein
MSNPLKIAAPPRRRTTMEVDPAPEPDEEPEAAVAPAVKAVPREAAPAKFRQVKEDERVQFNKRVTRRVADGFEMLAIRSHTKVPELLAQALDMLEERYGKVV